jgi:hypothetical protein
LKEQTKWVCGLALAIVVTLSLVACQAQEQPAKVTEIVNLVEAHPRPRDEWEAASVGLAVYGGGQVRTHADSAAWLELLEGNVRLSAETLFTVVESATQGGKLMTTLFLDRGRVWVHLTTGKPHAFTVETASAAAAVRDTRFSVQVVDGQTLVSVADGAVELTAQEQTVIVSAGQQAEVDAGQPPSSPEPMSTEESALWAAEGGAPEFAPPTPTSTSTSTPTPTPTSTSTPTPTPTVTPTPSPVPTPTPTATPSPTPEPGLSELSGEWAGTVTTYQVGECTYTREGEPLDRTLKWVVSDGGEVEIGETEKKHWAGTVGTDLVVSLVKTFQVTCHGEPRTGTASYQGQIEQVDGGYKLEIEAVEDWCPPTCRFRVVYSIVKEGP